MRHRPSPSVTGLREERLRRLAGELGGPEGPLLTAEQIAASVVWAIGQPPGVDVNTVTVGPVGRPV